MTRFKTFVAIFGAIVPLLAMGVAPVGADDRDGYRGHRGGHKDYRYDDKYSPGYNRRRAERNRDRWDDDRRGRGRWDRYDRRHHVRRDYGYGPPPWARRHRWKHGRRHAHVVVHKYYAGPRYGYVESDRVVDLPTSGIGHCNRDVLGAIIGGASGALIGSQFGKGDGKTAATIGGAIVGLLVGGNIGRAMDNVDQSCIGQTLEHAPTGQSVAWKNPDGAEYKITPTRTYEMDTGSYCREYTTTIIVGGRAENGYGTACRQPDGSWEKQS